MARPLFLSQDEIRKLLTEEELAGTEGDFLRETVQYSSRIEGEDDSESFSLVILRRTQRKSFFGDWEEFKRLPGAVLPKDYVMGEAKRDSIPLSPTQGQQVFLPAQKWVVEAYYMPVSAPERAHAQWGIILRRPNDPVGKGILVRGGLPYVAHVNKVAVLNLYSS